MDKGGGVDRDEALRRMTQLMLQGAVMLEQTCPLDGLPLFRLRSGEIVCPVHGRVMIVSDESEAREAEIEGIISMAEYVAAQKVKESLDEGDPKRVKEWLDVIESVERIKSLRRRSVEGAGKEGERGGRGKA